METGRMNEAQKKTLARLPGWEVQNYDSAYLEIGHIYPDGRFVDMTSGPTAEVVTVPEGTVVVGKPA